MIKTFKIQSGIAVFYAKDSTIFRAEFYNGEFLIHVQLGNEQVIPHIFYITDEVEYYKHILTATVGSKIKYLYSNPTLEDSYK